MTDYLNQPYMVNDLVVYPEAAGRARVIDVDCRYELITTTSSCTCCTFRFGSRRNPDFRCKHIKALKRVLDGEITPDYQP
ncbi:MAG: hypothetical protein K6T80_04515 [Firmicutes bacterium]|nr:hypothetical protein [Bacillota bacterium]